MSLVVPPQDTYFIHGLNSWGRNGHFRLFEEISVSLQKDGYTNPLRSFGFVLEINSGGILAAFDCDITSKVENGKKVMSWQSRRGVRSYCENTLDQLIANTSKSKHNELWVKGDEATIVGGYITEGGHDDFLRIMKKKGLPVRFITLYCSDSQSPTSLPNYHSSVA